MIKITPWSQVQYTELFQMARLVIYNNSDHRELTYHNWNHVKSMYQYLADTNEPYDEALDWAVLFHDIVYDDKPEKEYRSMKVFADMVERYEGCTPDIWERDRVCKLIMYTVDHVVTQYPKSSAIVRADLHGLTNRLTSFRNYGSIMEESINLYGVDEATFAKNNYEFMAGLRSRVATNTVLDPDHGQFYLDVANVGISLTMQLSQLMQGNHNA
jgi:predicted metal-dependent HD superfamily phosphohydrolase